MNRTFAALSLSLFLSCTSAQSPISAYTYVKGWKERIYSKEGEMEARMMYGGFLPKNRDNVFLSFLTNDKGEGVVYTVNINSPHRIDAIPTVFNHSANTAEKYACSLYILPHGRIRKTTCQRITSKPWKVDKSTTQTNVEDLVKSLWSEVRTDYFPK